MWICHPLPFSYTLSVVCVFDFECWRIQKPQRRALCRTPLFARNAQLENLFLLIFIFYSFLRYYFFLVWHHFFPCSAECCGCFWLFFFFGLVLLLLLFEWTTTSRAEKKEWGHMLMSWLFWFRWNNNNRPTPVSSAWLSTLTSVSRSTPNVSSRCTSASDVTKSLPTFSASQTVPTWTCWPVSCFSLSVQKSWIKILPPTHQ